MRALIEYFLQYPRTVLELANQNIFLLQSISVVISTFLVWGIIYCIINSQYINFQIEKFIDVLNLKILPKRRATIAWRQIQKRMQSGKSISLKIAILQADKIFDEILKLGGVFGETMDDRLKNVTLEQVSNLDKLIQAHKVAKKIIADPEFFIDKQLAEEVIKVYEDLFKEYGLVD